MEQLSFFDDNEGLHFPENLLEFTPGFIPGKEAFALLDHLISSTPWKQYEVEMYGKKVLTPRLTAWFGDANSAYKLSGKSFDPHPWTNELLDLKLRVEAFAHEHFNSVLLNYYRDGNDSVAWHADNEKELGPRPLIASVSLGQARKFDFRHKEDHKRKYSLTLTNGSLLIMKGDLQHHWEHRIAKSAVPMRERINLTFRIVS